jgi:8-oxo-dGTP pyrophosphatase MutT (NUDIX family)
MNRTVHKVSAYVTCNNRLLVFSEPEFPEAGIQIPSGTVGENESPGDAVLREAFEETGLSGLEIVSFLGTRIYNMRPITGKNVDIHRHYYHLSFPGPVNRVRWQHWERNPSEGAAESILFDLHWADYPDDVPELSGSLGDMLHMIKLDA